MRDALASDPYRSTFYAERVAGLQRELDEVFDSLNA